MNYQRMWYKLKEQLMAELTTQDERRKSLVMDSLLEMDSIEIKEREDSEEELKLEGVKFCNDKGVNK